MEGSNSATAASLMKWISSNQDNSAPWQMGMKKEKKEKKEKGEKEEKGEKDLRVEIATGTLFPPEVADIVACYARVLPLLRLITSCPITLCGFKSNAIEVSYRQESTGTNRFILYQLKEGKWQAKETTGVCKLAFSNWNSGSGRKNLPSQVEIWDRQEQFSWTTDKQSGLFKLKVKKHNGPEVFFAEDAWSTMRKVSHPVLVQVDGNDNPIMHFVFLTREGMIFESCYFTSDSRYHMIRVEEKEKELWSCNSNGEKTKWTPAWQVYGSISGDNACLMQSHRFRHLFVTKIFTL